MKDYCAGFTIAFAIRSVDPIRSVDLLTKTISTQPTLHDVGNDDVGAEKLQFLQSIKKGGNLRKVERWLSEL